MSPAGANTGCSIDISSNGDSTSMSNISVSGDIFRHNLLQRLFPQVFQEIFAQRFNID